MQAQAQAFWISDLRTLLYLAVHSGDGLKVGQMRNGPSLVRSPRRLSRLTNSQSLRLSRVVPGARSCAPVEGRMFDSRGCLAIAHHPSIGRSDIMHHGQGKEWKGTEAALAVPMFVVELSTFVLVSKVSVLRAALSPMLKDTS